MVDSLRLFIPYTCLILCCSIFSLRYLLVVKDMQNPILDSPRNCSKVLHNPEIELDVCRFYIKIIKDMFNVYHPSFELIRKSLLNIRSYKNPEKEIHDIVSFDEENDRFAYIFAYCFIHSIVMYDRFSDMLKSNPTMSQKIASISKLRLCLLGGGPGFEVAPLSKILNMLRKQSGLNCSPLQLNSTIIDVCKSWEKDAGLIISSIQKEISSSSGINMDFEFIAADLTSDFPKDVTNALKKAHIVTMFKFLSDVNDSCYSEREIQLMVHTEMGKRLRTFMNANYKKVFEEGKENIKEFAMMNKKKLGKFSCQVFLERVNNHDDCVNVSKTLRKAQTKTNLSMSDSTLGRKHKFKSQDSSAIKNNESEFHDPRITKEAIVLLKNYKDVQKETMMFEDNSNVTHNVGKDKNALSEIENNTPECECHSTLLLKEFSIVLDRLEDVRGKTSSSNLLLENDGKAKQVPNKSGKGTKRKSEEKSTKEDSSKSTKSKKQKVSGESKSSKKEKIPDVSAIDFSNESKSSSGKTWNFKISSWNVNGIRAWLEKNGLSYLHHEQPDILCIQETKCSEDKIPDEVKKIDGYHSYWLSGDKDGYSGVGLLTKEKPIKVEYGIGISEHDNEGRVITAEYEKFYLVSTYVPNAGRGLVRLDYRMKWDKDFREYLKKLDSEKPIILTGDLNVAHEEIDLANPKTNKKNAGFTKEEREGFSALLKEGFIDTFRQLYPDLKGAYTFWTYMMNARAKNVGWRLDYFVLSERFTESLCDNVIRKDVFGSDHCPITLFLSL